MKHFIAYHSARTMGYEIEVSDSNELRFLSRKIGLLKQAIGNTVWVVQGVPEGKSTTYFLCGAYIANHIDIQNDPYAITGPRTKEFSPFIKLNDLSWFSALKKTQANFSLGFNRVSDESVVQELLALQSESIGIPSVQLPNELEAGRKYIEGAKKQIIVNAYEREPKARNACLAHYGCNCVVCGFNFEARYGKIGKDFIHIHHLKPLALTDGQYELDPIVDLRPVCPNCHAMLHRGENLLSIEDLHACIIAAST